MDDTMVIPELANLVNPIVVIAFSGWSDASSSASNTVEHLTSVYNARLRFAVDPSDYYDFQVSRPTVRNTSNGERVLIWSTTEVSLARVQGRDLVLIDGPEPNFHWPQFAREFSQVLRSVDPDLVAILGSMLSELPHTRPVPVTLTSTDARIQEAFGAEAPTYEGPTGISGVIAQACSALGLPAVSLWASVPHYLAAGSNPKATLALLSRLEDFFDEPLELGELPKRADAWEASISAVIEQDRGIATYIHHLEENSDETPTRYSGDDIAAEFQRYFRNQSADGGFNPPEGFGGQTH
ncbi:MAG: PAC2 family protein [Propionibacteriaceae bacterium]|jgi:hypothetical protein|nr:PAC2 family protein [Propionibacteriaceae bacterium]